MVSGFFKSLNIGFTDQLILLLQICYYKQFRPERDWPSSQKLIATLRAFILLTKVTHSPRKPIIAAKTRAKV